MLHCIAKTNPAFYFRPTRELNGGLLDISKTEGVFLIVGGELRNMDAEMASNSAMEADGMGGDGLMISMLDLTSAASFVCLPSGLVR